MSLNNLTQVSCKVFLLREKLDHSWIKFFNATLQCLTSLHKKWSFEISSVNMTKSAVYVGLVTFTEETLNGKFYFLCSAFGEAWKNWTNNFSSLGLGTYWMVHNFWYFARQASLVVSNLRSETKGSRFKFGHYVQR